MRKILFLATAAVLLSGCVPDAKIEAAKQAFATEQSQCLAQYESGALKTRVDRARCLNAADERYSQAINYPFPDLFQRYAAQRLLVADKMDSGQMSGAEADAILLKASAENQAEERRILEGRQANALGAYMMFRAMQPAPVYQPVQTAPIPAYSPPPQINCTSYEMGRTTHTNCQ